MRDEDTQNEAKINLARRAVACPWWRWLPGMRYQIVNSRGQIGGWMRASDRGSHLDALYPVVGESEVALPDLDDPATLGCLLALVREAWGDATIHVRAVDDPEHGHVWMAFNGDATIHVRAVDDPEHGHVWMAFNKYGQAKLARLTWSRFEAERLVAALEAAP